MAVFEGLHGLNREEGHAGPLPGAIAAAAGPILLGIGAASGTGWLAIVGGIVAGAGVLATLALHHLTIEYPIYERINKLEEKK